MGLRKRVRALEKAAKTGKRRIVVKWMEDSSCWMAYAQVGKYNTFYEEWNWNDIFLAGQMVSVTNKSREQAFLECLRKFREWQDIKLVPSDDETVVYV